ncbi:MAG: hypothetical protein AAGG07_14775, partial [Planctomycetota bacterium]
MFLAARALLAAMMVAVLPSAAAAVVLQIEFEATGSDLFTNPATGTVVLELEPGVDVEDVAVLSSSFNFGPISDVVFDIFAGDNLIIGGLGNADSTMSNTDDFLLLIFNIFDTPSFLQFSEQAVGSSTGLRFADTVSGTVTAVPLPAPVLLLLAGMGALGLAARRRAT